MSERSNHSPLTGRLIILRNKEAVSGHQAPVLT